MSDANENIGPAFFDHFMSACDRAASLIYHDVAAVEANVSQWRSDNPAVTEWFDQGVTYVSDLLTLHGVPVAQGLVVVKTIGAALKLMASRDASMATVVALPVAASTFNADARVQPMPVAEPVAEQS